MRDVQKVEEAGKEMEKAVGSSYPEKNRSPDVIPYDHSRVKLAGSEDGDAGFDYINASWIPVCRVSTHCHGLWAVVR